MENRHTKILGKKSPIHLRVPSTLALEAVGGVAAFDLQKPAPIVDVVPPIPKEEAEAEERHRYNDPSGTRDGEWRGLRPVRT